MKSNDEVGRNEVRLAGGRTRPVPQNNGGSNQCPDDKQT